MDMVRSMTLYLKNPANETEVEMLITPVHKIGDEFPSLHVQLTAEERETNNVRVRSVYLSQFDYKTYNWIGMLQQIFNSFDQYDIKNQWDITPPEHMTEPPRSRWFPALEDWRGVLRRQLGR